MLEERLSNAYGQHNLGAGYGAQQPRASLNMYPSLPSGMPSSMSSGMPNGTAGAESFYTGQAPPQPEPHNQTPTQYNPYPQAMSPQTYAQPPNLSMASVTAATPQTYPQQPSYPQQAPAYQGYASTPSQRSESSYVQESPNKAPQPQVSPLNAQPPNAQYYGANQSIASPAADAASYYKETPKQSDMYPQVQHHEQPQPAPHQPPEAYQHPQQTPVMHAQTPPQPHQVFQQPPAGSYWPPQGVPAYQSQPAPEPHKQAAPAPAPFTQSSFPTVPTHQPQPQPQPVEEALIEL